MSDIVDSLCRNEQLEMIQNQFVRKLKAETFVQSQLLGPSSCAAHRFRNLGLVFASLVYVPHTKPT
jgi:hypothetical protein